MAPTCTCIADALTSILAIVALLAGKNWGANWLDPAMGIVGAALVASWSIGLIRQSSRVLLVWQADKKTVKALRDSIETGTTDRCTDLHLWSIGHRIFSVQIAIVSDQPKAPSHYKALLPADLNVVHVTVEIHQCDCHGPDLTGEK